MQNGVSPAPSVADYVEVAAEALRAAIHAANDDHGCDVADVGEMYRAVREVALVVDRLPTLLRHLARRTERLAEADGLTTDDTTTESGRDACPRCRTAVAGGLCRAGHRECGA